MEKLQVEPSPDGVGGGLALLVVTCGLTPDHGPGDGLLPPLQTPTCNSVGLPAVDLLSGLALVGNAILPG